MGIEEILANVYNRVGDVKKVLLLGDYAKGIDSGQIEVLIVGNNIDKKYLDRITTKIEKKIKRNIIFFVSSKMTKLDSLVIFES